MSTLIKLRRDTATNWAAIDPVLQLGEPGYDTTNNELRIGDGTTAWSGLTPIAGGGGGDIGNLEVTVTNIGIAGGAPETVMSFGSNVANVIVDTNTGAPKVNIYTQSNDFQSYSQGDGDYTSAEWVTDGGGGAINITGSQSYFDTFMNTVSQYALVTLTINGGDTIPYTGASYGGGSITLYTSTAPVTDPTAVTSIGFNLTFNNGILLDPDEGDMLFKIGDFNLNMSSQRDINITSGDDLRLLGNDTTRLAGNAEVTIVSSFNTDPNYTWTFNTDGNLILPGSGAVSNPINSSLDPLNPNVSTMVLTPDANYGFQALVLDPTAPGHIHLRAPSGGGNIDQPAANIFLGGEQSSFEVGASYGDAPNVFVHSGNNTWTFDTVGNLTLPPGGAIQTAPGSSGNILIHPDDGAGVIIQGGAATLLTLSSDAPDTQNSFEIDTYGANLGSIGGGLFVGTYLRTDGPTQQDDRLASYAAKGTTDGISLTGNTSARISLDAASNWSAGNQPTHISFWTTAFGTDVVSEKVRIGPAGNIFLYTGSLVAANGFVQTGAFTVGNLPAGGIIGERAMVTDADTRTWGNLAVGGAGNIVPVWSDGSNWYIG